MGPVLVKPIARPSFYELLKCVMCVVCTLFLYSLQGLVQG